MAKYMDGNGLSHFMSKIKAWANGAFLKLSGGTLTGRLTLQNDQYTDDYTTGALDLKNSNIQGVNSIYTADASENATEGIHFYRDSTHVDSIHANQGNLYFTPNRTLGSAGTPAEVLTRSGMLANVEMQTTNPFAPGSLRGPYISKIDNAFYAANKRWTVTGLVDGTTNVDWAMQYFFDGDYDSRYQLAKDKSCVITLDFSSTTYFPGYPYGYILVSFYYNEAPASVSGRVYCNYEPHGIGWHDISFSELSGSSTTHVYRSAHQGFYQISKLEITIAAGSSTVAGITQIEMHLDRPNSARNPFLSKYAAETLYYNLTAPKFIGALQGSVTGNVTGDVTGGIRPDTLRPVSANTTGYGGHLRYLLATSSMTTGKPDGDGHILDMEWDNDGKWHGQLSVPTANDNQMQWRSESGGTWSSWRKVFDDAHTVPVANGGTGKTTAQAAANSLLGSLDNTSEQSTDFTDNTSIITTNVNGTTGTYYHRKASLLWNYIVSKLSTFGFCNRYIRTQPEHGASAIIPFLNNDIAFLLKRGGSAVVKYDGVVKNVDISNVFDGSPSYWGITYTGTTEIVIELTLHKVFTWTNYLYIDFGPWYTKTVKVEVMYSGTGYPNDVWTEKLSTTTNTSDHIIANVSHTPVGASNAGGGFNKVRLTFSFANGAYSSTMFRIAQIGIVNYGSSGSRETYMSRGIDDPVFRNITPYATGTNNLGSSTSSWLNIYGNNIYTNRLVNSVQIGNSTQSTVANAGIRVNDVRNATLTNNMIDQAANFYFSMAGTPDATKWWSILHVKGWSGGYSAWELAGPASNADQRTTPLFVRTGSASNIWGDWRKILDASMLSSATNSSAENVPATPKAVKAAYDLASSASTTAGQAMSAATGSLVFKVTYSVSGSTVTCAAHVYSAGSEVTSSHADSCFVWSLSLDGGKTWTSLGTGKTKDVTVMSVFGGNVKCDFTPAS